MPAKADVVVVGSGYTGLHAALVCAEAGRETLVVDSSELGFAAAAATVVRSAAVLNRALTY
ncbi:FAD-dependent oxidoreductase [Aliamphritea spongicola]|nr:FAD-dependent oxidoreductase [Aliamphritea spongicola]